MVDVIITVAAIGAVYGIVKYGLLHFDSLGKRPQGISHHYMTFSGFLMLGISAVLARLVFGSRDRIWPALVLPAIIVALFLTLGRGAWVGTSIAVAVILSLKDFRLIAAVPVVVAVAFALAPDTVTRRMTSVFDLKDPSNRDRVAMLETGVAMIRAHPITGVGPNMVEKVYVQYRAPGAGGKSTSTCTTADANCRRARHPRARRVHLVRGRPHARADADVSRASEPGACRDRHRLARRHARRGMFE